MSDVAVLQGAVAGEVVVPGAPGYESARRPADARFHDRRPQAVVQCRHAGDVAETLAFARRSGVHVAARSGGHCFAGRSSTDGVVIDVSPMRAVSVPAGVATVGAGTRLGELYDRLDEHGVTVAAGCGPTVGIAGLTLGGGLGILGRRDGLTADQLLAAEVVLADGRVVACDGQHEEELFWALRGAGGGHFGVVTSLVFRTVPAPSVTTFSLTWPPSHAEALVAAWQDWAPAAPDELSASLRVTAGAGNSPAVGLAGAMLAGEAETVALLEQLAARARAEPASVSHARRSYREAKRWLAGPDAAEPADAELRFTRSEFFRRPLPREAIAALLRGLVEERPAGQSRELSFTPMGGAYNRVPPDATAFVHREERFLLEHVAAVGADAPAAARAAATAWAARSRDSVHPWGSGRVYPNFPDPDLAGWREAYYGGNHDRLRRAKRRYDPQNVFRFHQSL